MQYSHDMDGKGMRHRLLSEFTAVLYRLDPMGLKSPQEDEYESEALSILARFTESGLHFADSKELMLPVAAEIVTEVMKFWFDSLITDEDDPNRWSHVTSEIVDAYISIVHAKPEVVEQVTIG